MDTYVGSQQGSEPLWFVLIFILLVVVKMGMDKLGVHIFPKIVTKAVHGEGDNTGPEKAFRHVYQFKLDQVLNKYIYTIVGALTISMLIVFLGDIRYLIVYFIYVIVIHVIYTYMLYLRTK